MKSLKESLFDDDLVSNNIIDPKYVYPKDIDGLTESIEYYIELTNPRVGDTVDLNWIDTSKITDMSSLFDDIKFSNKYNYDLSKWDVSKVEDMVFMFRGCKYFNCDLSKWNVSKVTDMYGMFDECENFNCDLSKWDVSKVTDMAFMFSDCKNFNCDLSKWNVSKVINIAFIFQNCPIKEKNKPHFKI